MMRFNGLTTESAGNGVHRRKKKKSMKSGNLQKQHRKEAAIPNVKQSGNGQPRSSKVLINRQVIGSKSQQKRNMQNRGKPANPWDGNTDHVKRDFAAGLCLMLI